MSLAKTKLKETKGKQKTLPKLKAILANPYKTRCPILDEKEMEHLKVLLQAAIQDSKLEARCFATQRGICLGLESSLRNINKQTSSCVFISLSIKPNHIISLIARNAETKDETQPVYVQPKLENFIEEIFGVQALCMVFPNDLCLISDKLSEWVEERKKPVKVKKLETKISKNVKKIIKKPKIVKLEATALTKKKEAEPVQLAKGWTGDFISFGSKLHYSNLTGKEDVEALSEIMNNIPTTSLMSKNIQEVDEAMEVDNEKTSYSANNNTIMEEAESSENSDYFLAKYKNLTVHKIKGNPNKNPKKKRKKSKKKNTAK